MTLSISRAKSIQLSAAKSAEEAINKVIAEKGFANVVFAAAPSQNETLFHLLKSKFTIEKDKIIFYEVPYGETGETPYICQNTGNRGHRCSE